MAKPLRPLDLAGLTCDMCDGPAFTSEQLTDADLMDEETAWRNDWPGALPDCLCAACENRMVEALSKAPAILVPLPPVAAPAKPKKTPKTGNRR